MHRNTPIHYSGPPLYIKIGGSDGIVLAGPETIAKEILDEFLCEVSITASIELG